MATHWIRFFSIKKTRCSISIFFSTIKIFNRSLWCLGVTVVISFLTMKFFKSKCCRSWFGFRHSCLWDYVIQGQLLVFMEKIFCYEVTKMEKMILVVWMILSMMMLMLELAITGLLVKSGCPDQCWEICISYLFGTKKKILQGWVVHNWMQPNSRPPTAFIYKFNQIGGGEYLQLKEEALLSKFQWYISITLLRKIV